MTNTFLTQLLIAVASLGIVVAPAHTLYKLTLTNPDALCLDGTPGAYFIREGDRRKILLYFEGGGWCGSHLGVNQTLDNCYQRTNMFLGSSIYYPNSITYSQGIFSDHPKNIFRDWTLVHLKYCDGGGHQGYRKEPVDFYGFKLYFRGHNITVAQLEAVDKSHKLFSQATQIVVSGQSAGGLATYMWSNYIAQRATKQANVWAVPDSGIFLNFQNYTSKRYDYKDKFMNLMTFTNAEVDPPNQECVRAHQTEKWKRMFAEYIHEHVRVPLFAINSLYDSWSIAYLMYMKCGVKGSLKNCDEDKIKCVEEYKRKTSVVVESIARRPQNGAPACSNHVYTMFDEVQWS